jgi:DNA-binding beta-propeller fold protein YncE
MEIIRSVPGGINQNCIFADATYVYAVNSNDNTITFIDDNTKQRVHTLSDSRLNNPWGITSDNTNIYVTNSNANTVTQYNISTKAFVRSFTVGSTPKGITYDGNNLWVANYYSNSLSKINLTTAVVTSYTGFNYPHGVVNDGTYIYVADAGSQLCKVRIENGGIASKITTYGFPYGICLDNNFIWIACQNTNNRVYKYTIPLLSSSPPVLLSTYILDTQPYSISSDNTTAWVAHNANNTTKLTKINISTGTITTISDSINMPTPQYVYCNNYYVWVGNRANSLVSYFINPNPVTCYNEGTLILISENDVDTYKTVENLKLGDLVKTYYYDTNTNTWIINYKPLYLLGKKSMINDPTTNECMYKIERTQNTNLISDLIVTGGHLVNTIHTEKSIINTLLEDSTIIDNIPFINANKSPEFIKLDNTDTYNYYHFVLSGELDKHYCVNANGILSESTSSEYFFTSNFLRLC